MSLRLKGWAEHKNSVSILLLLTFLESWIFPIPPDPMFFMVALHNRDKIFRITVLCTLTSVVGGVIGYFIGVELFNTLGQWILSTYHCTEKYHTFQAQFQSFGFLLIVLKGLTPIPYKVVAIACGVMKFPLHYFISASIISRGIRFTISSLLCFKYGEKIKPILHKYLLHFSVLFLVAVAVGFAILRFI